MIIPNKNTILNQSRGVPYVAKGLAVNIGSRLIYKSGVETNQLIKQATPKDAALYKSGLGTDITANITIPAFSYTDAVSGFVTDIPEIVFDNFLISTTAQKVIVKTYIQGLPGTVKEYITNGDNQVIIEGVIAGQNGVYPYDVVNALNKLSDVPVAFRIVSRYLQNLDIDTIVIESSEINQDEGGYSFQKFKLYCITDIPVELNIISSSNTTSKAPVNA